MIIRLCIVLFFNPQNYYFFLNFVSVFYICVYFFCNFASVFHHSYIDAMQLVHIKRYFFSKSWVLTLLFLYLFLQSVDIQAQKIQKSISLNWKENLIYHINEDFTLEMLYFDGAISDFNYGDLPVFCQKFAVDKFFDDCDIQLSNQHFVPIDAKDRNLIQDEFLSFDIQVFVKCFSDKKRYYAVVSLLPFVKDASGQISKLVSFDLSLNPKYLHSLAKSGHNYSSQSVLASGLWFKVGVTESGLYKISYDNLVELGYSGGALPSELLGVFGNGTGRLSEVSGTPRPDDLLELPIEIHDGGDGSFGPGDYLVFYAKSPHGISYDAGTQLFTHQYNIYSNYSCYFLCVSGVGNHKRVNTSSPMSGGASRSVTDYVDYKFSETDVTNLDQTGQEWFSDLFDVTLQRSYNFTFPNVKSANAKLTLASASTATSSSSFSIFINGNSVGVQNITSQSGVVAKLAKNTFDFVPMQTELSVSLNYNRSLSSTKAYLDYIAIQALCDLRMNGSQMRFNNAKYLYNSGIASYEIANAGSTLRVWDVTTPENTVQMPGSLTGSTFKFLALDTAYREYVAFDGSSYKTPALIGSVANQNLHSAESQVDMVVIAHPDFLSQAQQLATYRRQHQGISVRVVTPSQVYNEFSSGAQDPVAIRDYMKMIYEKSNGVYPKYLLLFGRPSYDYRGLVSGTSIYVPNYQRPASSYIAESAFRANDDFFGILDDGEGECSQGMVDVAVGRFPVSTAAQADLAVRKCTNYTAKNNLVSTGSAQISNFADWRNVIAFVADDGDMNEHFNTAEACSEIVADVNPIINLDKIYCDAYVQKSNSGGQRFPEVTTAINDRMSRGALFFTYVGHSGKDGWAHERILEYSDINNWKNAYNQPIIMTLSCDFAWYDRPEVSPGEACFFNTNGGATGLLTTSRVAYGGSNAMYAKRVFSNMFNREDGRCRTIGELNRKAKNEAGGNSDALSMFIVLGDPSMPLALPEYYVVTDSINGQASNAITDTLKALSEVVVKGRIVDENGNVLPDFNGNVFTSFFDKEMSMLTLGNDPEESQVAEFKVQKNVLFKGNNTVSNGQFTLHFIVPKDIDYSYGNGKFSYYARSNSADAAGFSSQFLVGGNSGNHYQDNEGPQIDIYLNDDNFVNKGITNANPLLLIKLQDELGVNTTGNGVGHDLVAILDDANDAQIVLNDHYEAEQDSCNKGTVRYQLSDLTPGNHKIKVRAWDILNNVSEREIEFVVANEQQLTLDHVLNYPNPFTTNTDFFFEHNHPGEALDVLIQIFTIGGKVIKTISETQFMDGNRSNPIHWDGRDEYGDKIGKGTYIYRLRVRTSEGKTAEKIEKLVIL